MLADSRSLNVMLMGGGAGLVYGVVGDVVGNGDEDLREGVRVLPKEPIAGEV